MDPAVRLPRSSKDEIYCLRSAPKTKPWSLMFDQVVHIDVLFPLITILLHTQLHPGRPFNEARPAHQSVTSWLPLPQYLPPYPRTFGPKILQSILLHQSLLLTAVEDSDIVDPLPPRRLTLLLYGVLEIQTIALCLYTLPKLLNTRVPCRRITVMSYSHLCRPTTRPKPLYHLRIRATSSTPSSVN